MRQLYRPDGRGMQMKASSACRVETRMSKRSLSVTVAWALAISIFLSVLARSGARGQTSGSLIKTIPFVGIVLDSTGAPVAGTIELFQVLASTNTLVARLAINPTDGSVSGKVPVDLSQPVLGVEVRIVDPTGATIFDQQFSGQTVTPGTTLAVLLLDRLRFSLTLDAATHAMTAAMVRPTFVFP